MKNRTTKIFLIFILICSTGGLISKSIAIQKADEKAYYISTEDIQEFANVIAHIKHYYIKPIKNDNLVKNAIKGMLARLDPHSSYLDKEALKDLQSITTGKFGGIGVEIIPENGFIKVISPIDDAPAAKGGIKAGDLIIRINNKLVKDMTLGEAIKQMRGKKGTKVKLTILRKTAKKPIDITLRRAMIKIQTIKYKMLESGFGYIRVTFFQQPTEKDLLAAVKGLKSKGKLKGLVLDLRNNPGGLLDASVKVTDVFLDAKKLGENKLIVYTKGGKNHKQISAKATPGDLLTGIPIVVLINEGSASASEIVAGALQDHKRAIILGTKSFGKGSVQTVIPITKNSAIKLTTALYYTPKGRSIQAEGIAPDVLIADLKIPKETDETLVFDPIDESDLQNHLANGNSKHSAKDKKANIKLAKEDFQLYEALNLLKGLSTYRE